MVVSLSVAEPIPLASDTVLLTYAAVFDRNADSIDNFQALPQFALDFFQDTDLWYEARWTSSGTWRLTRWIVVGGVARTFETRAVVVLVGNVLMFVIPRDEFPATTTTAPFRVSAFVSDRGDPFGLNTVVRLGTRRRSCWTSGRRWSCRRGRDGRPRSPAGARAADACGLVGRVGTGGRERSQAWTSAGSAGGVGCVDAGQPDWGSMTTTGISRPARAWYSS